MNLITNLFLVSTLTLAFIPQSTTSIAPEAPKIPLKQELTSSTTIIAYIKKEALKRNIEPQPIIETIKCESSFNPKAVGDAGMSRGLVQIHKPSHTHITDEQAFDPEFAIDFILDAWENGQQRMWTCARMLGYTTPAQ
jgi:soluble lytic murein transglycosylase-like protein